MNLTEAFKAPAERIAAAVGIPVTILPDVQALYLHIARNMADTIRQNNAADKPTCLILPVGPIGQYPKLAEIVNRERIDLRRVVTFNMDEYCDWRGRAIGKDHPMSFERTMKEQLWARVDDPLRMPLAQMHFPDPQRCAAYDEALDRQGPVDVCYASVGYHGHVAFNEGLVSRWFAVPIEEFAAARTHIVPLAPSTIVINSLQEVGGNCEVIPPMAVTVGMGDILASKRIECSFYCGAWQRTVFRRTLFQAETVAYPGTLLRRHPDLRISSDADSAAAPKIV